KKDGHTAGLLRLQLAMTRDERINPNEPYESEREAFPSCPSLRTEGEAIQGYNSFLHLVFPRFHQ
ncbi:MAG: hypothetical protein RRY07_08870, partial [Bacteroidaceae bacterium]